MNKTKRLLARANGKQTLGGATVIISGAYLLSRVLGLLRDRLLIAHFGKGPLLDAYNAAFSLPDLLFTLLVSGAFAVAFIPVFTAQLKQSDQDEAWDMASTLLNLLVIVTIVAGILGMIFASPLVRLFAVGFPPAQHDMAVRLTRIMLLTPILFAISSVLGSIQQALNRFLIYALASVFYNVGIIAGILFFAPHAGIYGVAWGVVFGTILQALLQWFGLIGLGYHYRPVLKLRMKSVRRVLILMGPRAIDQGMDQINYVVEKTIGSTLAPGTVTAYALANNLKNVPLSLIGNAIATAAFPRLSAHVAEGKNSELADDVSKTARLILFLALPSAAVAIVARGYIVRLLYGFGDTDTANTLGWFAGTIVFTSLFFLISRIFYAYQDTRTPLIVSLFTIATNMALAYTLSRFYGIVGLAMAASIVDALEVLILLAILERRQVSIGMSSIVHGSWRMVIAASATGGALYALIHYIIPLYASDVGFIVVAPKFLLILVVATATYTLSCFALRLHEAKWFWQRLREIVARPLGLT